VRSPRNRKVFFRKLNVGSASWEEDRRTYNLSETSFLSAGKRLRMVFGGKASRNSRASRAVADEPSIRSSSRAAAEESSKKRAGVERSMLKRAGTWGRGLAEASSYLGGVKKQTTSPKRDNVGTPEQTTATAASAASVGPRSGLPFGEGDPAALTVTGALLRVREVLDGSTAHLSRAEYQNLLELAEKARRKYGDAEESATGGGRPQEGIGHWAYDGSWVVGDGPPGRGLAAAPSKPPMRPPILRPGARSDEGGELDEPSVFVQLSNRVANALANIAQSPGTAAVVKV
jgi:hypothetical protein